jgi:hypothetical protein
MSTSIPKPWAETTDDPVLSPAAARSHPQPDQAKTILLVDDDPVALTVCGSCLEDAGYRVLRARSGPEAIRLCREQAGPIHLLLTDYVLAPQTLRLRQAASRSQQSAMNGLQLMREVQAVRPTIPVIVMSGHTDANLESLYRFKNGRPFLRKPFNLDTLLRLVSETLEDPAPN